MKFIKFLFVTALICYIIAVGYNVLTISDLDIEEKFDGQNGTSLVLEVASRLGLVQTLGIIGNMLNTNDANSILENDRALREFVNVLYDWYAPIKWPPVLDLSKEIGWFLVQNTMNNQ